MSRIIYCLKMQKEAEGLVAPPYPGELGKKIYLHICQEAWREWLKRQTMIINEYRLNLVEPDARKLLEQEMERFLFGDGGMTPEGYRPT